MGEGGSSAASGGETARQTVAVDAMGGEKDPLAAVWGALDAMVADGSRILLVGDPPRLQAAFDDWRATHRAAAGAAAEMLRNRVEIVASGSVIGMDEHPAHAVRAKKDASVVVATRLVAEGRAGAAVSAGNSGATLAAALITVGRIRGVARPAIGILLPTAASSTLLLDAGANTDCKPEWLTQFAVMGDVYARLMLGRAEPRVGLLSNGEEAEKGSQLIQEAHRQLSASRLRFVGNVEGSDLLSDRCDVVVTDGFTGNVALKTAEGVAELLFAAISREARASLTGRVGGALLKSRLRPLRDRVDYRRTGGALLLGVAGEVVIAHGRSDALAMCNAVRVAGKAAGHAVSSQIATALLAAAPPPAKATGAARARAAAGR